MRRNSRVLIALVVPRDRDAGAINLGAEVAQQRLRDFQDQFIEVIRIRPVGVAVSELVLRNFVAEDALRAIAEFGLAAGVEVLADTVLERERLEAAGIERIDVDEAAAGAEDFLIAERDVAEECRVEAGPRLRSTRVSSIAGS